VTVVVPRVVRRAVARHRKAIQDRENTPAHPRQAATKEIATAVSKENRAAAWPDNIETRAMYENAPPRGSVSN